MTDTAKRRTLKGIAAVAAGTASAGLASNTFANNHSTNAKKGHFAEGHLAIRTRLSAQTNEVEAVFQNAGDETLSIDSLGPHEISTFRGKFDVQALTANRPLVLAPGESVSVALNTHDKAMQLNDLMTQGQSLSQALQASASAVSTAGNPIHVSVYQTQPFA